MRSLTSVTGPALTAGLLAATLVLGARPAAAIVGGGEAAPGGTVMVLASNGGFCSGIVVAPDAVLTAGHCVAGGHALRVHVRGPDGAPVLIDVAAKAVSPGYDAGAVAGRRRSVDLALIRTAEPLPARFPPVTLSAATPRAGDRLTIAGYGAARPGDPRTTGTFRSLVLPVVEPHGPSRILIWLRGEAAVGACQGDSGGPVTGPDGTVLGVTAWVEGRCGGLTQAVRLGPQRDWIDGRLGQWRQAAQWSP